MNEPPPLSEMQEVVIPLPPEYIERAHLWAKTHGLARRREGECLGGLWHGLLIFALMLGWGQPVAACAWAVIACFHGFCWRRSKRDAKTVLDDTSIVDLSIKLYIPKDAIIGPPPEDE